MEAHENFKIHVEKFEDFWNLMDDIYKTARVIDPPKSNRSHTYRRIMIMDRVILHLEVNPLKPRDFPEVSFTGPDNIISSLEALVESECKVRRQSIT